MEITYLVDVADLTAAVGVIASLVFVGVQIKRNARETRLANFQNLSVQAINWAKEVAASDSLSKLYARGLQEYAGLSEDDRNRFNMLMMSILIVLELFYVQQARQLQSRIEGDPPHKLLLRLVSLNGFVAWWQMDRRIDLGDEMITRIDELIAARPR